MIELKHKENKIWSQRGEDGIIEAIFTTLNIKTGYAVELGAWDGIKYSNVYNLITKGWSATLIEGDEKKHSLLVKNMEKYENVKCVQKIISLERGNTLDEILIKTDTPRHFDILSLDLDGCDYWIWDNLRFHPKVVIVEYNSNWEDSITVPYNSHHNWDGTQFYGASGLALTRLAGERGYDLIGHIPNNNLIFIDKNYNRGNFPVLDISTGFHVSKHHHPPMNERQEKSLIINPPISEIKKIHVGCGKKYLEGWVNVDINSDGKVDIKEDVKSLHSIKDNSCDIIYGCHILEHFGRYEYKDVLKTWFKKLRPGGILRLAVPDLDKIVDHYNKTHDLSLITGLLIGGQRDKNDYHGMIYNKENLSESLLEIGFYKVREWDWRKTSHRDMDDYSQAYLPHMDKKNGILMSLNLEAIKL
jgi:predicted SAM-dependent methyltransferase